MNNSSSSPATRHASRSLWGGRFKKEMHPLLKCFSYSLATDGELFATEVRLDIAWAKMLGRIRLITPAESVKLVKALHAIGKKFQGKPLCEYIKEYEDVHSLIQSQLEKKTGLLGKKIHTGRSRNDLVVTSTRLYLRGKIALIQARIGDAQRGIVSLADQSGDAIVAGMTHLKKAQPVLLAHHLLAYVEMLEEDSERLADASKRLDVLPLGAAALAGSSLPLDQKFLAKELGFSRIATNSLAAVSDRAFLAEFLSVLSILWMHLSRLAEDFILWNSEAFGYIELDDQFATGSSLMPQKKNPDVFELIRGRSGVIFGHLQALLVVQKGLPLAYNRDLQEDKPATFDAIRKTLVALELVGLTAQSATLNRKAMEESVLDDNLYATDILEYLVRKKVPFSEAHEAVGRAVRHALDNQKPLREISVKEWKRFSAKVESDIYDLFDPKSSVRAKKTIGSTNPSRVSSEIKKWEKLLK